MQFRLVYKSPEAIHHFDIASLEAVLQKTLILIFKMVPKVPFYLIH